jgi:hypothetical protein
MLAVRMVMVTLVLVLAAVLVLALVARITSRPRRSWEGTRFQPDGRGH